MDLNTELLVFRLKPASLDEVPLGVVRLSLDGRLSYMNRAAQALAGPEVQVGTPIETLSFAPSSEQLLQSEISARQAGRSGSYGLALNRPDLGIQVHLNVAAVPEYDAAGEAVGSLGFVSETTMQRTNLAIHEAIGAASDWRALLGALDEHLREVLAYDSILVSLVSEDRSAVRIFYQRPDWQPESAPDWRWWPMPEFVRADLDTLLTTRADDLRQMFGCEPYRSLAESDAATRDWLKLGYRHMLRRPVMRNGRLAAIVSVLRLEDRSFTAKDIDRLEHLPIGEAVNMALALDHQKELEFGLELIGHLGEVAGRISEVGRVLVEELRRNYAWEHVSLFRVNVDEGSVSIVYQSAAAQSRLRDNYEQPIETGLLGHVARSGQAVRLADVRSSSVYFEGIPGTRSEMCLPVPGQPVRWILNVESAQVCAFAAEEQAAVSRLLEVAGLILDRTMALQFNAAVLDSVADAVIQTTSRGEIQNVNPACETLLGWPAGSLIGRHLSTLISAPGTEADPAGFAQRLVSMERVLPGEVELLPREGAPIPVLLSGESLPPQIGGKVYVASDLRFRQEVQRMDSLRQVFRQVASETRLPLALAGANLRELGERLAGDPCAALVDKILRQLRRADLPLERVVRLAAGQEGQELPLQPMLLGELAERLVAELPPSQELRVSVSAAAGTRPAMGAQQELEFCAFSLLVFLLRMKAQRDEIRVSVGQEQQRALLSFDLVDKHTQAPSSTKLVPKSAEEREFALAEPVIRALMRRMRGSFDLSQRDGLSMRLTLSTAEAE